MFLIIMPFPFHSLSFGAPMGIEHACICCCNLFGPEANEGMDPRANATASWHAHTHAWAQAWGHASFISVERIDMGPRPIYPFHSLYFGMTLGIEHACICCCSLFGPEANEGMDRSWNFAACVKVFTSCTPMWKFIHYIFMQTLYKVCVHTSTTCEHICGHILPITVHIIMFLALCAQALCALWGLVCTLRPVTPCDVD